MSVTNDIVALIYFMSGGQYMINLLNIADLSIVAFAGVIFAFAVISSKGYGKAVCS